MCPVDKFTYIFCKHLSLESGNEDNIYVSSGKEIKCFDVRLVSILWAPKMFDFSTFYFHLRETPLSLYYPSAPAITFIELFIFISRIYVCMFARYIVYITEFLYTVFCFEGHHQMGATGEL